METKNVKLLDIYWRITSYGHALQQVLVPVSESLSPACTIELLVLNNVNGMNYVTCMIFYCDILKLVV